MGRSRITSSYQYFGMFTLLRDKLYYGSNPLTSFLMTSRMPKIKLRPKYYGLKLNYVTSRLPKIELPDHIPCLIRLLLNHSPVSSLIQRASPACSASFRPDM